MRCRHFSRLFHVDRNVAGAAMHDFRRRLRRIRGCSGLAAELFPDHAAARVYWAIPRPSPRWGTAGAGANALALKYADQLPAVVVPEFLTSLVGAIDPAHQHEGCGTR